MVKIAVDNGSVARRPGLDREPKPPDAQLLAAGDGWTIHDVICTAGPADRAFEEQHSQSSVAVVVSGTFQYRTSTGHELMTPGSLLLGNRGESFACGHEHGVGDRCISFHYSDVFRERAGIVSGGPQFHLPRIPAIPALTPLVATVGTLLRGATDRAMFQEVAFQVFDRATRLQDGLVARGPRSTASALAGVTRVLRAIEADPGAPHDLSDMAASARLSPYHFLRCFEQLTGTTPRQYLLRTRLRWAAIRLKQEPTKVIEIALDCGFGDVSNFNRAFRAEFGNNPRAYRRS